MLKFACALFLLGLLVVGCSNSNRAPTPDEAENDDLFQVGEMYRTYQTSKNHPPVKFADLQPMRALSGNAYEALQKGEIVLYYGMPMTDLKEELGTPSSDVILAYKKEVPQSGGKVLFLDRHTKTMTPEEFKAAPKAEK